MFSVRFLILFCEETLLLNIMEEKYICRVCGKESQNTYSGDISLIMKEFGCCFTCAFWIWQHRLDQEGNRVWAIIDGKHYVLCPHTDANWPVGMGGQRFTILFNDGRVVECDNLWHQGQIPEHFRDVMQDNARFI